MPKNNYKLTVADRILDIELQYALKKRLTLTVYPDQRIVARIPYGMTKSTVESYFLGKSKWLLKHLNHFEKHPPELEKLYLNGERFSFLGKKYELTIHEGKNCVSLEGDKIILQIKDIDNFDLKKRIMQTWYRNEAIKHLSPMYETWIKKLTYLKLPKTTLRFYRMKRRWGSCSSKGVITLNTELVKKDYTLIDYVIVHEICHLKVPAHNKAFYELMGSVMADWKSRKTKLNNS